MAKYYAQISTQEFGLDIMESHDGLKLRDADNGDENDWKPVDFVPVHASPTTGEGLYSLLLGGKSYQGYVERTDTGFKFLLLRHRFEVSILTEREWRLHKVAPKQAAAQGELVVTAPMPGLVKSVLVASDDQLEAGQPMLVLEAMKMENEINSPRAGRVTKVHVVAGAIVESGRPLVTII